MAEAKRTPRSNRFPIPLRVHCSFERVEGIASLINISYTGALLENTAMRPEVGTRIHLYLHLKPPCSSEASKPSELIGIVIRHSSDGFAVVFEDSRDLDMRRMVDDATALLATRR